jgi:hypothetical protein
MTGLHIGENRAKLMDFKPAKYFFCLKKTSFILFTPEVGLLNIQVLLK